MPRRTSLRVVLVTALAALALAACGTDSSDDAPTSSSAAAADDTSYPITIEHALGETVIEKKPERVATVAWSNHEVPLALGIVPVGMSKAAWGDDDGDGVLPWVEDKLDELHAKTPVLFDESDGIDFEAVADTRPDVILAAYSGLTEEDYEKLSKIAPTVAYPGIPWATSLDDTIKLDSEALGMKRQGEELIAALHEKEKAEFAKYPALAGKKILFSYIDPKDMSQVGFYTTHDTRPGFLSDLGSPQPKVVVDYSAKTEEFYQTVSAEDTEAFDDVDVFVTYGNTDGSTLAAMQKDPLLSKIPAIKNGAVAVLADSTPLAASANPSPLSIDATLDEYFQVLSDAAAKAA
ncbi:iron-siderophore ABC transporter substrate-binding protein [Nocardioides sp. CER19]|uniref:iron-siderophore ABC transporter substrate-binding protein n=1 Tax=Nocardioides sp. CER19 TaxID=3038538 RepID=UPI0024472974|nr:iron-siderophore ABC transporter substrate-binding protein [Nocardioides sp. CER19]MDH2413194.1 iron-siderophore ABC transporter substrate-binding protein [Nocardioides sp. CER19]